VGQIYFGDIAGKWVRFTSALTNRLGEAGFIQTPQSSGLAVAPNLDVKPRDLQQDYWRETSVQQHAQTFFAEVERDTGAGLPQFVKDEFDAFLECGILAHGFLRLRCADCGHDQLVAFSCKRRGFCPSCGARRMSQTAAHLVDHVIPHVQRARAVQPRVHAVRTATVEQGANGAAAPAQGCHTCP
jgi:hypothetical protein